MIYQTQHKMATDNQVEIIRGIALKCITLPECPMLRMHAIAARVMMEKEVIKLINNAINDIPGVAKDASDY